MESKYMTKATLAAVNKKAKNAGGKHIDPNFVTLLPERFKYPVCMALPFARTTGWVRCWVTLGADAPIVRENIHHLLLDMPAEVLESLPTPTIEGKGEE